MLRKYNIGSLAAVIALTSLVVLAPGCGGDDDSTPPVGTAGASAGKGGASGAAGKAGAAATAGGSNKAGAGNSAGSGGTEPEEGGAGAGGAPEPSGGTGGSGAGTGGATAGSGGAHAGAGGTSGSGGSTAGSGGSAGAHAGSGGSTAGSGGTAGSTAGSGGTAGAAAGSGGTAGAAAGSGGTAGAAAGSGGTAGAAAGSGGASAGAGGSGGAASCGGCVVASAPLSSSATSSTYAIYFPTPPVDLTGATVTIRLCVVTGDAKSLFQAYVQSHPDATHYPGNFSSNIYTTLDSVTKCGTGAGFQNLTMPVNPNAADANNPAFDPAQSQFLTFLIARVGTTPWVDTVVHIDSITFSKGGLGPYTFDTSLNPVSAGSGVAPTYLP